MGSLVLVSTLFLVLTSVSVFLFARLFFYDWLRKVWTRALALAAQSSIEGESRYVREDVAEIALIKKLQDEKKYVFIETSNGMGLAGFFTDTTDNTFEMKALTKFKPFHAPEDEEDDSMDEAIFAKYRLPYEMIIRLEEDFEVGISKKKDIIEFARKHII